MNRDGANVQATAFEILLVEDNPGDVRLTQEALKTSKLWHNLTVVRDGIEAMAYLHREAMFPNATVPDLILLDLNLPKKDGREVLAEIKSDDRLKLIPVVVLTTSKADEDIIKTYTLHANCYIQKPVSFQGFSAVVRSIGDFWFTVVKLPSVI
jgi:two-component system, chemotaxis family, response regulator Rcp1